MMGMIFDIQEMTVHDGPGARITFFMKGCPLRCVWCHNPEGQNSRQEIMFKKNRCHHCNACEQYQNPDLCPTGALVRCGFEMSSDELIERVLPLKDTLNLLEGGVTFSGGEPLMQHEFLFECLMKLKQNNIHTAVETCGYCSDEIFRQMVDLCDSIIMDIKIMDDEQHQIMTGVSNKVILKNAEYLMNSKKLYCFRTPVIEGITDTEKNLNQIQTFLKNYPWEKIPANPLAPVKYEQLNRTDYMNK